ncbi:Putative transport protein [Salmonella enterica subsp. enterica]|uniref:Transport protein n=1 Tax=Salmonella enterica I TaxID=59201 RepID=A0A3S4F753_SALET|nr:Putative transport protein [Salmonella enterica subsp. enterica]
MPILQWFLLFLLSLLISLIFLYLHLPAAMLLGPMIAGIVLSLRGSTLQLRAYFSRRAGNSRLYDRPKSNRFDIDHPRPLLAGRAFSVAGDAAFQRGSRLAAGTLQLAARQHRRMGVIAGRRGGNGSDGARLRADIRLVAFMQYLRVLFVAGAAVLVTRLILGDSAAAVSQQVIWFPPLSGNLLTTLLLAIVAGIAGRLMRIPSGTMLLPMLAGALLHSQGIIEIELPEWLLAVAYMAIGWRIGLGFDRQVFFMALRPLPQILLSIFALMAICAAMAWGMAYYMQIDFMTAYLATSPGGLDTVAAIAAGSSADMALIMAMQTLRLFSILLTGPAVARFISTYAPRQPL